MGIFVVVDVILPVTPKSLGVLFLPSLMNFRSTVGIYVLAGYLVHSVYCFFVSIEREREDMKILENNDVILPHDSTAVRGTKFC